MAKKKIFLFSLLNIHRDFQVDNISLNEKVGVGEGVGLGMYTKCVHVM